MAGTGRRTAGSEDRFSGLSEGQRYALALVLNLAFVGIVIGAFALLYTSGFNARQREEARSAPLAAATEPPASAPESRAARSEPIPEPVSESASEPARERTFAAAGAHDRAAPSPEAEEEEEEEESDGSFELAMLDTDGEAPALGVAPESVREPPAESRAEPRAEPLTLERASAGSDAASHEEAARDEDAAVLVADSARAAAAATPATTPRPSSASTARPA